MAKETKRRFQIDTESFVTVWANHLKKPASNDWKKFVLAVFARFTGGNEYKNMETLSEHDKNWKKWTDDQKYEYLSEKCYSKCIAIKRRLRDEKNKNVDLPNGYKERTGSRASKRITTDDIADIFFGD
jgi:hypothetical protein